MKTNHLLSSFCATLVISCALFMTSCSQTEYKRVIPANSPIVAEVDFLQLVVSSNADKYENEIFDLLDKLAQEDRSLRSLVNELKKDEDTGYDPLSPVYFFMDPSLNDFFYVFAITDKKLFKEFCDDADDIMLESEGDDYWIIQEGVLTGIWSGKTILQGSSQNKKLYRALLRQDQEHSFFATKNGKMLKRNSDDIAVALSFRHLDSQIKQEIYEGIEKFFELKRGKAQEGIIAELLSSESVITLEFAKGQIGIKSYLRVEDDSRNSLEVILRQLLKYGNKVLGSKPSSRPSYGRYYEEEEGNAWFD